MSIILQEIKELVQSFVVAFGFAFLINLFVFQPTIVLGNSMYPTLEEKDYIGILRIAHTLHTEPNYGDIVIIDSRVHRPRTWKDDLTYPLNAYMNLVKPATDTSHDYWIKRVVGKPGDVLEFKDGQVYRNGAVLDEPYIKEHMVFTSKRKIVVPGNHVYVLGDNRNNSADSRYIGPVPLDHVLGTMLFKL